MDKRIDPTNFPLLVTQLGDPVRARLAFRHLIAGGSAAPGAMQVVVKRIGRAALTSLPNWEASNPPISEVIDQ
jgi:hypothetical protein